MLNIRFNDLAAAALGSLSAVIPLDRLAPGLKEMIAGGVELAGEVVTLGGIPAWAGRPPGRQADLTGWECFVSSFHLEDHLPIEAGSLPDGEPVISEADQILMLRHGLGFALEIARAAPVPVRCVVGANSTNGTFRFHRARQGESWLHADLDGYRLEKMIVVDRGPASLGGTPW
ncbi:hypothetical protein [Amycolatopsis sp. EV170708-02-1]|uniref:hypothetical protein n=1 Tax=Amycolatopsis sp. EV170708-02-1 TaxID=2919322 RepID=UPI001F0C8BCB|nr:hypothetical protein [Amycolatopsis sp. EV170708-02-1]UMP04556.1 hypothetical protein MJQ72_06870 [Amycolatopsis sp. EV170708-02-1]